MSSFHEFSTPIKQSISESELLPGENFMIPSDTQVFPLIPFPTGPRKKTTPLQATSTKFQVKGLTTAPTFLVDTANTTFDSTDVTHSSISTEPVNGLWTIPIIEHLDLNNFKTKPCPHNSQHNHKHCSYYHNAKDRKRNGFYFSAELCEYAEKESMLCPNGDGCPKAHNRVEQLYRPEKYKTKFCTFYPHNLEKCEYGNFCSFAHSENDIVIELIHNYEYDEDFYVFHFKTVWCPFNLTSHDKALCVYAHNWQDYRRKPNMHCYEPTPCPNWKSTDFILNYEDGCPYQEKCNKCHGWKEHEYHPLNYKVKPCPATKICQKGRDCPHYHSPRERRVVNTNINNKVFRYVPRNRIITNTFKVRSEDRIYGYMSNPQTPQNNNASYLNTSFQSSPFNNNFYDHDSFIENHQNISDFMNPSPKNNYIQSCIDLGARTSNQKPNIFEKQRRPSIENENVHEELKTKAESLTILDEPPPKMSMPNLDNRTRKWSITDNPRLKIDSDRLFREIIDSPAIKHNKMRIGNAEDRRISEPQDDFDGLDTEIKNNYMLEKILGNEDM